MKEIDKTKLSHQQAQISIVRPIYNKYNRSVARRVQNVGPRGPLAINGIRGAPTGPGGVIGAKMRRAQRVRRSNLLQNWHISDISHKHISIYVLPRHLGPVPCQRTQRRPIVEVSRWTVSLQRTVAAKTVFWDPRVPTPKICIYIHNFFARLLLGYCPFFSIFWSAWERTRNWSVIIPLKIYNLGSSRNVF